MPLIDRAWKANVNVWKRHLTLQSVFNSGECMMHIDKNVDGHVLDVDRISREIAYVSLNGRIRSKRSSCVQPPFFFFEKKKKRVQNMLTSGLMDLKFWMCFPEVRWIEIWMCFPKVRWIWNLDVLPRSPMELEGIIHTEMCGPFTLILAKQILSINNRVIHWKDFGIPGECP